MSIRCAALGVSEQGYYAHRRRLEVPNAHAARDAEIAEAIVAADKVARGTYGTPRLRTALAQGGVCTSRRRIGRLKQALGLFVKQRRKFICATDSAHDLAVAPNLLARQFTADGPDKIWVSDITYLRAGERWVYLCTIVDCFSGRVVGRKLSNSIDAQLVCDTISMAIRTRQPTLGCIFHSDRGSQYASDAVRNLLDANGFRRSMSRRGDCWDNAVAESSFGRLKNELGDTFETDVHARYAVYEYYDVFHNHVRIHSRHNQSPAAFEAAQLNQN